MVLELDFRYLPEYYIEAKLTVIADDEVTTNSTSE